MNLELIAVGLGLSSDDERRALRQGHSDGYEQGAELALGMTYDDLDVQRAYDIGTHLGAWDAAHPVFARGDL